MSNGASADHVLPFHRAEDGPAIPTHDIADTHDTASSCPNSRRVPAIGDQRDPSHASAPDVSTITQKRREVHDRPLAKKEPSGRFRIDQLDPFHIPTTPDTLPVGSEELAPTATQNRGEPHDTLLNSLRPPGRGGRDSTDQAAPFQRSARSCLGPPTECTSNPTAVQADHDAHDTDDNHPSPGEGTTLQVAATAPPIPPEHSATIEQNPAMHPRRAARPRLRHTRATHPLSHYYRGGSRPAVAGGRLATAFNATGGKTACEGMVVRKQLGIVVAAVSSVNLIKVPACHLPRAPPPGPLAPGGDSVLNLAPVAVT